MRKHRSVPAMPRDVFVAEGEGVEQEGIRPIPRPLRQPVIQLKRSPLHRTERCRRAQDLVAVVPKIKHNYNLKDPIISPRNKDQSL